MSEPDIIEEIRKSRDPMAGDFTERFDRNLKRFKANIAEPGAIPAIPPLLEQKRLEHNIPDGCFRYQPVFDQVFIYQVAGHVKDDGAYGEDALVVVPENIQGADRQMTPTGVIVAAGLIALDQLRSHGMDLGHTVLFTQQAPHRFEVEVKGGVSQHVIVLRAGLIRASLELRQGMATGELYVARSEYNENGNTGYRHELRCMGDSFGTAMEPEIWEDV